MNTSTLQHLNPSTFHRVHFIGICGTAMGAVATAMKEQGWHVTGSDEKPYPPLSDFLVARGICLALGYRAENLPKEKALIVVGNAISRGNAELEAVLNRKLHYVSLPELLHNTFLQGRHNLVVAGTHGKTTTTSMLAWIFECVGKSPSYLIGGLPNNLGQGACFRDEKISRHFIIEGDEYDTAFFDKRSKFLHYLPELAIVNNIEFDHADIFSNLDEIKLSFRRLLQLVPSEGMILLNGDDQNCRDIAAYARAPIVEVGFSENVGNRILSPWQKEGRSGFELLGTAFELAMIGEHNLRNAAMAVSAAHFYGIPLTEIKKALLEFSGVKRRQEIFGVVNGITIIDDFGHHPTAIRQTLEGLRTQYVSLFSNSENTKMPPLSEPLDSDKGHFLQERHDSFLNNKANVRRVWAIFEPRSNTTRRAIFQEILPAAFAAADGAIIGAVGRAAELDPTNRLDPERLAHDIMSLGKKSFYEPTTEGIVSRLQSLAHAGDVIVIFSNGAFDGLHGKLATALTKN